MADGGTLVSISDCVAYFAQQGTEVNRSTISRFVTKHQLAKGTRGRSVLVDPAEVYAKYDIDYSRKIMSGEASGLRKPKVNPTLKAVPVDPAPNQPPGADQTEDNLKIDPARELKKQQVRRLARENAMAEGLLTPTAEVAAAMAASIAEFRAITSAKSRQFTEECVAEFGVPDDQRAALQQKLAAMLRDAQNTFAKNMANLLAAHSGQVAAVEDLLNHLAAEAAETLSTLTFEGEDANAA